MEVAGSPPTAIEFVRERQVVDRSRGTRLLICRLPRLVADWNRTMDEEPKGPQCECGWPRRAVADKPFPITYDARMGEFQLVLDYGGRGTGSAVLRYCPWCGGRLPESKRRSFFTVPSESDLADIRERMKSIKSFAEMRDAFGERRKG